MHGMPSRENAFASVPRRQRVRDRAGARVLGHATRRRPPRPAAPRTPSPARCRGGRTPAVRRGRAARRSSRRTPPRSPGRNRPSTCASAMPRDHVDLVAGRQHRRVGRVAQRRTDQDRDRAELGDHGVHVVGVEVDAEHLGHLVEEPAHRRRHADREPVCRPSRATASHSGDHRVVVVDHRAVPGAAAGREPHPGQALLGRLDQVEPRVRRRALTLNPPTSLMPSVDALEQLAACRRRAGGRRARRRPPRRPGTPARRRARACAPRAAAAGSTASVIASMSFMSTAPRPQTQPSFTSPENGWTVQSAALAGTTSRCPWISTRRPAPVRRRRSGRSTLVRRSSGLDDLGLDADLGELGRDVLGGCPLPRPGPVAEVGRVDPDQLAAQLDDLVGGRTPVGRVLGGRCHGPILPPADGVRAGSCRLW